jgi:hypothetical protein
MFQIILPAFKQTFQHKRIITLLYFINLGLALVLAIPFFWFIKNEGSSSMEIAKLLPDFDDTVFTDFMQQAGKSIENYLWQGLWLALFSGIVSIFLAGGVLEDLKNKYNGFSTCQSDSKDGLETRPTFFGNCGKHFRRFCWLTLFKVLALLVIFFVYLFTISLTITVLDAEVHKFIGFFIPTLFFGFIALLFILMVDYAQIALVQDGSLNTSKALGIGSSFVFKHFLKVNFLAVLLFIAFGIATYLYWTLEAAIGMTSAFTILFMLIIQQIFIWLKMSWRVWFYASEMNYFTPIYIQNQHEALERIKIQQKIAEEKAEKLRLESTENIEPHEPQNE